MSTPSQEDYLEIIWILIQEKGYARVVDVAEHLKISTASASKMIRRLHQDGLLTYERYRGFNLTSEGLLKGQRLYERHRTLERLLTQLEIGNRDEIYRIVEGIEHHFSVESMVPLRRLVRYIDRYPDWWQKFIKDRGDPEGVARRPEAKSSEDFLGDS